MKTKFLTEAAVHCKYLPTSTDRLEFVSRSCYRSETVLNFSYSEVSQNNQYNKRNEFFIQMQK